ncbi:hypothetical protein AAES_116816 [Amazona aestiva]|uniref:Uncharacterized protein n=1 Tax=Amazona aestiva TaxID=12930 RepID=A0A0Q3M762_AMAAE|nr:hypothetical protein AAES_116816 [Amazona aestiva]
MGVFVEASFWGPLEDIPWSVSHEVALMVMSQGGCPSGSLVVIGGECPHRGVLLESSSWTEKSEEVNMETVGFKIKVPEEGNFNPSHFYQCDASASRCPEPGEGSQVGRRAPEEQHKLITSSPARSPALLGSVPAPDLFVSPVAEKETERRDGGATDNGTNWSSGLAAVIITVVGVVEVPVVGVGIAAVLGAGVAALSVVVKV